MDDPSAARIDEYEATLMRELAERQRVVDYVRRFLKEEQMFEVKVKQVEEQPYVSRSKRIRVADLERFVVGAIDELMAWPPTSVLAMRSRSTTAR